MNTFPFTLQANTGVNYYPAESLRNTQTLHGQDLRMKRYSEPKRILSNTLQLTRAEAAAFWDFYDGGDDVDEFFVDVDLDGTVRTFMARFAGPVNANGSNVSVIILSFTLSITPIAILEIIEDFNFPATDNTLQLITSDSDANVLMIEKPLGLTYQSWSAFAAGNNFKNNIRITDGLSDITGMFKATDGDQSEAETLANERGRQYANGTAPFYMSCTDPTPADNRGGAAFKIYVGRRV